MIIFIISSFFIMFSYIVFFSPKFKDKTDVLIAGFTISFFQIILTQVLLGLIQLLTPLYVISFNIFISLLIFLFSINKIDREKFRLHIPPDIKNIKTIFFLQMIIISYGLILFLGLLIPPYAWDSITYHLTTVFHWVKAEKIFLIQPLCATSFFPMNGSLSMLWLFLTSKNMNLLNLTQVPFAFMLTLATFSLSKKLKIRDAIIVIPIVLLTPVVMLLCSVAYVDIILSCFVIVALNFIIGYFQTKKPLFFLLSCTALGLASGVKPGGIWAFVVMLLLCFFNKKQLNKKYVFAEVILGITSGGFWYLRNFILTGNPIFPYVIKFFNLQILNGVEKSVQTSPYAQWFVNYPREWLLYPVMERIRGVFTYSIENGFGMQFILGATSLCYALYISLRKNEKLTFFVFLLFPLTIIFWFSSSSCPIPRYVILLCPIAAIATIYVYNHLDSLQRKIMSILLVFSLTFSFITTLPILIPHQAKVLHSYLRFRTLSPYNYYRWIYGPLGSAWEWLDKNLKEGSVIACNYDNLTAPVFGNKLQHNIIHIVTYKTSYDGKPKAYSYEEFKKIVARYNVSHLLIVIPYWESQAKYSNFRQWIDAHLDHFEKIKSWSHGIKQQIVIYKVK